MSQMLLHHCPQCGQALAEDVLFCDECGYTFPTGHETDVTADITSKLSLSDTSPEPEIEEPLPAPESFFDTRYPRSLWHRFFRRLVVVIGLPFASFYDWLTYDLGDWRAFAIVIPLIYLAGALISFILGIGAGFTLAHIFQALLFNKGDWWKTVFLLLPLCVVAVILTVTYESASEDLKNERVEIQEREHPSGLMLRAVLRFNGKAPYQIVWSPDGKMLAARHYSDIELWRVETNKIVRAIFIMPSAVNIAWSPDGNSIAVLRDTSVSFWNVQSGAEESSFQIIITTLQDSQIVWSSRKEMLAFAARNNDVTLLNSKTGQMVYLTGSAAKYGSAIAWAPDGKRLAIYADDGIQLWNTETSQLTYEFPTKENPYNSFLAWSPNGSILASSEGSIILLWHPGTGQQIGSLENARDVTGLSFSSDSRLLTAKMRDLSNYNDTVQIWRTDTWDLVVAFSETARYYKSGVNATFHPTKPDILATGGLRNTIIRVWKLDLAALLSDLEPVTSSVISTQAPLTLPPAPVVSPANNAERATHVDNSAPPEPLRVVNPTRIPSDSPLAINATMVRYTNAKVVLLGDSGVGKSGLGLVLSRQPFEATKSTHGRRVWMFASAEVELAHGRKETRETLLWDLAGQPGYRLIHQLHLNEVTVALIVIDARSETDPFAGVYHWERALRQAQQARGSSAIPVKKLLVAARIDRSGIGVSRARIEGMLRELGFAGYFETSAKDGRGIQELQTAIEAAIAWDHLPWVISTRLFQQIKDFLVAEKEAGRVLTSVDDLYRSFRDANRQALTEIEDLPAQFETCIGRVESRGLLRRLSFGNLVLLQPELLDAYASALINEVRDEPDGLGSIAEARVIAARFAIPADERLKDRELEKVLLIAMTEDLLRYELALREQADDGQYLVFPSQSTRENPDLPDPEGKAVTFSFEGPVQNIYATLAVRLSHSGFFQKKELWKNAIAYTTQRGGTCGIFLQHTGEGQGRLTIFFDQAVSSERRTDFEAYIETYLRRKALPESIQSRRVLACHYCHTQVTEETVQKRRAQGRDWLNCPVCDQRVSLLTQDEKPAAVASTVVQKMDRQADIQRDLQTAVSILQGKRKMQDFDVFLCHHGADKPAVKRIGEQLKIHGLLPWLDEWELRPGLPWQQLLEEQIAQIKSAAVFVGPSGIGPWQHQELDAFLREFVHRGVPVIPVLLPDAPKEPRLPIFLSGMTWVDFRHQEPDPMQRLLWGITGKR